MSVSTTIRLPLAMRSEHLLKVVAKLMGVPSRQASFDQVNFIGGPGVLEEVRVPTPFDGTSPSSKDNSWYVNFDKHSHLMPEFIANDWQSPLIMCNLKMTDPSGAIHHWPFFSETEHENCKELLPDRDALAVGLGWRLVEFFGGKVQTDASDKDEFVVDERQALYPALIKGQTSDDRWYMFQNALHALPVLTLDYLKLAADRRNVGMSETSLALSRFLMAKEAESSLEAALPNATLQTRKPGPRM